MKFKTAILGYGRSGSTLHADPIEKSPDFDLTAVCDIDEAARKKAFDRFGCRQYENYKEMLAKEESDLVVIVTRSDQHCQMACDCLFAGNNVLVTKPWAKDSTEAKKLMAAAEKSGKLLLPWLPARWGCDLIRIKELVESGAIGKVFQVRRSEYTFGVRNDWQIYKKYAGGYLLNWGPHVVDQPMQLLGTSIRRVYAEMRQINNPGDVEDVFYSSLKTDDDVIIICEYNIAEGKMPTWVVQGSRGTIYAAENTIELHKVTFSLPDDSEYRSLVQTEVITETVEGNRFGDSHKIYEHIAKVLKGEEPYKVTLESAAGLTQVLDAIRRSSETNTVVTL